MNNKGKCVEYYFDSSKYDEKEILEKMKKEQIGFEKKNAKISIKLNEYGIYIVQLKFEENRPKIFTKIVDKRNNKINDKYERYLSEKRIYGQYKETKTYQPI